MNHWKLTISVSLMILSAVAFQAVAGGKVLEMKFTMRNGRGDSPMAVAWLENDVGDFIQTVHMFSKSKKYYKDLLAWKFKSRKESKAGLDAISGATIKWKRSQTITVPVQFGEHNLLDGTYILRLESRKDKGGHYRSFKIPLPKDYKGGTHEHEGYIKQVQITVKGK